MSTHFSNRTVIVPVLSVLSIFAAASAANAQNSQLAFNTANLMKTGSNGAQSVAVGDINGDGKPDMVVANVGTGTVAGSISLLLGLGDGTFAPAVNYAAGGGPVSVAIADVNGDGRPDVVVANNKVPYGVSILTNTGASSGPMLALSASYLTTGSANAVAVGDFNGDGKPDIAVVCQFKNQVFVFQNSVVTGVFTPGPILDVGTQPVSIATADFDGNGHLDLVTSNVASDSVSLLKGNGNGTFQAATNAIAHIGSAYSVTVSDFNKDGYPDIAVADYTNNGVQIALNDQRGGFAAPRYTATWDKSYPYALAAADLNGDGVPDLVVTHNGLQQLAVLVGNKDGTFQGPFAYAQGTITHNSVAATDLNGDGTADIAMTNTNPTWPLGVMLNETANVSDFTLATNSIVIGNSAVATVTLNRPAPIGGAVITLSTTDPTIAMLPDTTVTVKQGDTTKTFAILGLAEGNVSLSATLNGITVAKDLAVTKPVVTPPPGLAGDLNHDGVVDILDATLLLRAVGGLDTLQ